VQTPKIIVITNGNFFARIILTDLFIQHPDWINGVLIVTGDYKGLTGIRSLIELSKVTAWPYLFYKVLNIFYYRIEKHFDNSRTLFVKDLALKSGFDIKEIISIKSREAIDWVKYKNPDIIVSVSCPQLIGKKILDYSRLGGINIHSSLLPQYAGLAPYFWVLADGKNKTGTTIHYMTSRFDQGNILVQKEIEIQPRESAFNLFCRLSMIGQKILVEAINCALNEDEGLKQNLVDYSYYSNPSLKGYINLLKNNHTLFKLSEFRKSLDESVV
jgi:folate-dependent phosphoribosylglycinamide formyltransferase PurN